MSFGNHKSSIRAQRPSGVERIGTLPDYIPLEENNNYFQNKGKNPQRNNKSPIPNNINYNYHNNKFRKNFNNHKQSFPTNKKRRPSEDPHNKKGECSRENARKRRQPSPVSHSRRSKSPMNLVVRVKEKRNNQTSTNNTFEPNRISAFSRLGDYNNHHLPSYKHMPIVFDLNDTSRCITSAKSPPPKMKNLNPQEHDPFGAYIVTESIPEQNATNFPDISTTQPENNPLDILITLEADQKELMKHCNGLRDTIDEYYREVSKLEAMIYTNSQEIEILKRRFMK